jgi:HK97 family phage portal protein
VRVLGFDIKRAVAEKAIVQKQSFQSVSGYGRGGWFRVLESFTGAWQTNTEVDRDTVLSYSTVFACVTLIAQDIGKLSINVMEEQESGFYKKINDPNVTPVLKKPNQYQTGIKFREYWISSKLVYGNSYGLKERDKNGVIRAIHILDPTRCTPLVTEEGSVYYKLKSDTLAGLDSTKTEIIVPASEILHDPMVTLFHPLVGVTPIYACGLAAMQGVNIQRNSKSFFGNQSQPGGILVAPGEISETSAANLKEYWEENFTGDNAGRIAVVGDGLKYEPLTLSASDAQMIEQLKMSAETVCSCFHVPPYMVGVGPLPSFNNIEALTTQYYSQCLQSLIESMEAVLDGGMELKKGKLEREIEMDVDDLLRMDTATRYKTHTDGIAGGWMKPNEARLKENMEPVKGGDTPYLQQQNYSLAALAQRDSENPLGKPPASAPAPAPASDDPEDDGEDSAKELFNVLIRGFEAEEAA